MKLGHFVNHKEMDNTMFCKSLSVYYNKKTMEMESLIFNFRWQLKTFPKRPRNSGGHLKYSF